MAGSAVWFALRSTAPPRVSRLLITSAERRRWPSRPTSLAFTPDGTRVVYAGANNTALFVRALDQLTPRRSPGSACRRAVRLADGQWIRLLFDGVTR
jgi:hypothetical protein